jgi:hypothetical protein
MDLPATMDEVSYSNGSTDETANRRVGKGGREASVERRRLIRRAHATGRGRRRPRSVGTAEQAPCHTGDAAAAFAHPTGCRDEARDPNGSIGATA